MHELQRRPKDLWLETCSTLSTSVEKCNLGMSLIPCPCKNMSFLSLCSGMHSWGTTVSWSKLFVSQEAFGRHPDLANTNWSCWLYCFQTTYRLQALLGFLLPRTVTWLFYISKHLSACIVCCLTLLGSQKTCGTEYVAYEQGFPKPGLFVADHTEDKQSNAVYQYLIVAVGYWWNNCCSDWEGPTSYNNL